MKRFQDKVAVITGATSGIGRATALAFAKEGAHVAIAGRRMDRLQAVAREARGLGVTALCLEGDVCDPSRLKTWARAVEEKFGHADYLINGAGVLGGGSISDTPDDEWDVHPLFRHARESLLERLLFR